MLRLMRFGLVRFYNYYVCREIKHMLPKNVHVTFNATSSDENEAVYLLLLVPSNLGLVEVDIIIIQTEKWV